MIHKPTFTGRIKDALLRPRQFMVVDGRSGRPARNMLIRPLTLLLTPLLLLAATFILGTQYTPDHDTRKLIPQNLQLQRDYDSAREKLAESEAMDSLKAEQLKSLQGTIDQQQERIENLKTRISMFESILEARKTSGVQILKANVRRVGDMQLEFNMALVKGGNYPRRVSGHVQLLAIDSEQHETPLLMDSGEDKLPYRMETHTFLHGTARWEAETAPKQFVAVLYNRGGDEIARTQCELLGGK